MVRLSLFLSFFFSFFLQGESQYSPDTFCRENNAFIQIKQDTSSSSAWGLLTLLESEETEVEEEAEEYESNQILVGQVYSILHKPGQLKPHHLNPTKAQFFSVRKKTPLFVLFGQFLI